jgi:hypothetical protein
MHQSDEVSKFEDSAGRCCGGRRPIGVASAQSQSGVLLGVAPCPLSSAALPPRVPRRNLRWKLARGDRRLVPHWGVGISSVRGADGGAH